MELLYGAAAYVGLMVIVGKVLFPRWPPDCSTSLDSQ
jgi:hypothetical protein